MEDMNQVIEDAVNDAQVDDSALDVETTTDVDASSADTSTEVDTASTESDAPASSEPMTKEEREQAVAAKGTDPLADAAPAEDEFAKKFGIASKSVTGRENRIPYSRVKKITAKAVQEEREKVTKELEAKYQGPAQETATKIKTYEEKFAQVAEFEKILENDPKTFLERLSQVPAYKPFFEYVRQLAGGTGPVDPTAKPAAPTATDDPRPLPNKVLADGSKVYDLEGLDALMAWQSRQVEKKVAADLEQRVAKRYEPIEAEWKQREYLAKMQPIIDKQIAEARTWPLFVENEAEITKALQEDPNLTLDGAWRKIVPPKMMADRNKMRSEIVAELKKAPASTTVPAGRTAPAAPRPDGPRKLEDIIAAEIAKVSGGQA